MPSTFRLAVVFSLLLAGAASAQSKTAPTAPRPGTYPGPEVLPKPATADDKCKNACAREQTTCMMPCLMAPGADAPEKQAETMACVSKCTNASAPCFQKCEKAAGKKPTGKPKDEP